MSWYPHHSGRYHGPREEGHYYRGWGRGGGFTSNAYQWDQHQSYFDAPTTHRGERSFGGRDPCRYQRERIDSRRTVAYEDEVVQPMEEEYQTHNYQKDRVRHKEHHCKCCSRNRRNCETAFDHSVLKEELEMMEQDEPAYSQYSHPSSSRHERVGSRYQQHYGYDYPHYYSQQRHRHQTFSRRGSLHSVAKPTIGKRRMDPPIKVGGRYFKDYQTRSYWQQLQAGLEKGERGLSGIDLKSDSAVDLTLDDIISKTITGYR